MINKILLLLLISGCKTNNLPSFNKAKASKKISQKRISIIKNNISNGTPEIAVQKLKPLLHKSPKDPQLHNLMGLALLSLKSNRLAERHFRKSNNIKPSPRYSLNYSSALIAQKKSRKALKLINKSLKKWPNYQHKERFYNNLGYLLKNIKRYKKSAYWYRRSLEQNPAFYPAYIGLAGVEQLRKNYPNAIKTYYKSRKFCLSCLEPVQALANIFMHQRKYIKAKNILKEFLSVENLPNNLVQRAKKLYFKLGALQAKVKAQKRSKLF